MTAGEDPSFEPGSQRITIPAAHGSRTLLEAVRRLDEAGITPDDVTLRKPTLDDVFLSLTGHATEAAPAASATGKRTRRGRRSS